MKNTAFIVIGAVIFGGLLFWAAQMQQKPLVFVEGTRVACLPNGHENIAIHIHPELSIMVNGQPEVIPANIGITSTCMSEVHTHDASGMLHIETATAARLQELSFADFFDLWGQPIEREGYALSIKVNGKDVASPENVPLEDHAQIELSYTSL